MSKQFTLDLRQMLPVIREAFDNKTLQMFKEDSVGTDCLYSGPCAIGVCIPEEDREYFDSVLPNSSVDYLLHPLQEDMVEQELALTPFVLADESQEEDIIKLQNLHDSVVTSRPWYNDDSLAKEYISKFHQHLVNLEEMYLAK